MFTLQQIISGIPKAELHLHIEGSFEPELMFQMASKNKISISYPDVESLKKAYQFSNLQEFLDIYYIGARVLKDEEDFYNLTMAYLTKAASQGVVYAELFFDPQTHLENNIDFPVFFNGIYQATMDAKKSLGIDAKLILCFLRHLSEASAFDTLEKALPFKDKILGIGLDSSEVGHPPVKFKNVFSEAKKLGFKIVAHAGEEGPPEYIKEALEILQVDRIDHGNRIMEDEELIRVVAERKLALTLCPLSNQKLAVVTDLAKHPLKEMMNKGLRTTINSDDPAYFGGYISENYFALQQALDLKLSDIITLAKNSFDAAFISEREKDEYKKHIDIFIKNHPVATE
jgi:adenosine deaminase